MYIQESFRETATNNNRPLIHRFFANEDEYNAKIVISFPTWILCFVSAFLGETNNYIVSADPRDFPRQIIPLNNAAAFKKVFSKGGLDCIREHERGFYTAAEKMAISKSEFILKFRGGNNPALFTLLVDEHWAPKPAPDAEARLQAYADQWQADATNNWSVFRSPQEEKGYQEALLLPDIPSASLPRSLSLESPQSLPESLASPAETATKQTPKPMTSSPRRLATPTHLAKPAASQKQLQKAPQRIPPGMQPFSRTAEWKWGCAPGAMEVKKQKILKLALKHSEAPPTPPAPSQSTQVPAKETLPRKKWRFWCSPSSPWLGRVPWGERWGA